MALNILHVIHDFLPRHRAGSEIYAATLAAGLAKSHHVTVLCAAFDPGRRHGEVTWRVYEGLPVIEIVNNWVGRTFEETYRPALMNERLEEALEAVQPDIVHVHSLLNLSFDLPAMARARHVPVVATLHDYTLVCPSGGQRVHRAESHLCETIDPSRCARCFKESPFYTQLSVGAIASSAPGGWVQSAAGFARRRFPSLVRQVADAVHRASIIDITPEAIEVRLERARALFADVDLVVAPSKSIAEEFVRLGVERSRLEVSANGQAPLVAPAVQRPRQPLRIGFVGTVAWHKGVHTLLEAVRSLPVTAFEVWIFGTLDVAPDYVRGLRAQAVGLPVRFEGPFESQGAAVAFGEIDVLVVPSLWPENAPMTIQEAFQAGVPVVAARIGGIPEFVQDGVNGRLFGPGRAGELAEVLRELLDHPTRVSALAQGRPAVRSIDDDVRGWESRYARVLAQYTESGRAS